MNVGIILAKIQSQAKRGERPSARSGVRIKEPLYDIRLRPRRLGVACGCAGGWRWYGMVRMAVLVCWVVVFMMCLVSRGRRGGGCVR
eukprot:scaffold117074_cov48-Cyclotella_meneghiniana.AAC.1